MKNTTLVLAAILISLSTFAQTTVNSTNSFESASTVKIDKSNSEINSAGNVQTATAVQSGEVNNASQATYAAEVKSKNEVAVQKKEAAENASTDAEQAKNEAVENASPSTTITTNNDAALHNNSLQAQTNTLLNNGAIASSTDILSSTNILNETGKANVSNTVAATSDNTANVKSTVTNTTVKAANKINTSGAAIVKTSTSIVHTIKPIINPVKINTHINTISAIKIK